MRWMHSLIFEEVSLSLLSNSLHANVSVYNLKIISHKHFEGDTLAMIKLISFDMSIKEFFKPTKEDQLGSCMSTADLIGKGWHKEAISVISTKKSFISKIFTSLFS